MLVIDSCFDINSVKFFNKYYYRKHLKSIIILLSIMVVLAIILFIVKSYPFGIGVLTFSIIYLPIFLLLIKNNEKKLIKNMHLEEVPIHEVWEFDQTEIRVTSNQDNYLNSSATNKYSNFVKAIIKDNYLLLFINVNQAHVIDIKSLNAEELQELKIILEMNYGDKFNVL